MNKSTVGELIIDDESCQYGLGLPAEEYTPNKVRYLRISDLDDSGNLLDDDKKSISAPNIQEYILKPNDLVVARTGNSTGRTYVYSEDDEKLAYAGFLIKYVFDSEKINPRYMKYFTISNIYKKQISGFSGSTRGNMNAQNFKDITVIYPDRKIQDKMVELFDLISKKIKNNNKIISELESMVKTIYDYWFLQFEFPNEDGKPYKSSGGKMVWNEELKREIPEGWKVTKLDKCVETIIDRRGVTPKKLGGDWVDEGIIALSAKVVKNGRLLDLSTANKVSEEMYDKWMPTKLVNGDILMTSEAPLGEFYYLYDEPKYCLSQRLFAIRAKKHLSSLYLYYELSKGNGFSQIKGSSSGSTVFGIRQDELRQIKILVPNEKVMQSFQSDAIKFISLQHSLDRQNQELASLRDFLLPILINGQVTFKEDDE